MIDVQSLRLSAIRSRIESAVSGVLEQAVCDDELMGDVRRCCFDGCSVILSRYNDGDRCSQHNDCVVLPMASKNKR